MPLVGQKDLSSKVPMISQLLPNQEFFYPDGLDILDLVQMLQTEVSGISDQILVTTPQLQFSDPMKLQSNSDMIPYFKVYFKGSLNNNQKIQFQDIVSEKLIDYPAQYYWNMTTETIRWSIYSVFLIASID